MAVQPLILCPHFQQRECCLVGGFALHPAQDRRGVSAGPEAGDFLPDGAGDEITGGYSKEAGVGKRKGRDLKTIPAA